jgi:hypothetical protein
MSHKQRIYAEPEDFPGLCIKEHLFDRRVPGPRIYPDLGTWMMVLRFWTNFEPFLDGWNSEAFISLRSIV